VRVEIKAVGRKGDRMKLKLTIVTAAVVLIAASISAQTYTGVVSIGSIQVQPGDKFNVPVSINLDEVTFLPDTAISLFEVENNHKTPVPFQIENGEHRILNWIIRKGNDQQNNYVFELVKGFPEKSEEIKAIKDNGKLIISSGDKDLLCYNFKTLYPPAGIDTSYKRSGFIHLNFISRPVDIPCCVIYCNIYFIISNSKRSCIYQTSC